MKVLTFGELLLRLSSPGYNKLFQIPYLETSFCGGEANVAVSLANYGVDSVFLTKLPNNDIGMAARNVLRSFGVNTDCIIEENGRMGIYYLEKGASQRPSKVIYDRKESVIAKSKLDDFDWDKLLDDIDWFHFSGITPALSSELEKICNIACKKAKEKNIMISCDLNYRKNLWTKNEAQKCMSALMQYVDICIGNEEDADNSLGINSKDIDVEKALINQDAYVEIAKEISRKFGCKRVAFTLRESYSASVNGWSGMLYDSKKNEAVFSTKYNINIIDRVGGGDSFTAGIIFASLKQENLQRIIDFAVAASCLKQTLEGDFNRVSEKEVWELVNGNASGRVKR